MNIFKTFEMLLSEPLSLIRKRVIQILHVETNIFARKIPMAIDFNDDSAQITVFNNEKVYKLLTTVMHKRKKTEDADKVKLYN